MTVFTQTSHPLQGVLAFVRLANIYSPQWERGRPCSCKSKLIDRQPRFRRGVDVALTRCRSLVIDGFLNGFKPSDRYPVIYFYCDPLSSAEACLRSILRQLVQLGVPRKEGVLNEAHKLGLNLGHVEMVAHVKTMIKKYELVTFVVDSLDKCILPAKMGSGTLEAAKLPHEASAPHISTKSSYSHIDLLSDLVTTMMTESTETSTEGSSECCVKVLISSVSTSENIRRVLEKLGPDSWNAISIDNTPLALRDVKTFVQQNVQSWKEENFIPAMEASQRDRVKEKVILKITENAGPM